MGQKLWYMGLVFMLVACGDNQEQDVKHQLANPASEYCAKVGGKVVMEQRANLGQMGVCYFDDNRQCEEWALMRGHCPKGGLKVTGYLTPETRYCAITGGQVTGGNCILPNDSACELGDYYEGQCPKP